MIYHMPFRKNIQRENILLNYWRIGTTVKRTSLLTDIPEGTISHYFARFNKSGDKYRVSKPGSQEPPRSTPLQAAIAFEVYHNIQKNIRMYTQKGDYQNLYYYLSCYPLIRDLITPLRSILYNLDPNRFDEFIKSISILNKISSGDFPPSNPTVNPPPSHSVQTQQTSSPPSQPVPQKTAFEAFSEAFHGLEPPLDPQQDVFEFLAKRSKARQNPSSRAHSDEILK
ncbi:MAG: hypothetical protein V1915_00685 [Candidatus Bathyarchaeota archaeon]